MSIVQDPHDKDRSFRFFYHIAGGTITIYEDKVGILVVPCIEKILVGGVVIANFWLVIADIYLQNRNAGRLQGKFLEKTKVKKPNSEVSSSITLLSAMVQVLILQRAIIL